VPTQAHLQLELPEKLRPLTLSQAGSSPNEKPRNPGTEAGIDVQIRAAPPTKRPVSMLFSGGERKNLILA